LTTYFKDILFFFHFIYLIYTLEPEIFANEYTDFFYNSKIGYIKFFRGGPWPPWPPPGSATASWGNVLRAISALTRTYCQLDLHHQLNGDEFRTYSEACQSFNRAEAAMVLAQKPFQWVVTPTYSGNTIPPPPASVRLSKRKWVVPFGGLAQLPTRASPPGGIVFAWIYSSPCRTNGGVFPVTPTSSL